MTTPHPEAPADLPPLPMAFDYCYEWDTPFGIKRKFEPDRYNGSRCDRSYTLYTADQMHAHAAPLVTRIAELERENAALRADGERLDWLEGKCVNVRLNLRYGSLDMFWCSPEDVDGGPDEPSDIRKRIDQERALERTPKEQQL